jgi:Trypsin-like peptidase domain
VRTTALMCCLLIFVSDLAFAQEPPAPAAPSAPFTKRLKQTVVFIKLRCEAGGKLLNVSGTGFMVMLPDERLGKDRGFTYLVTNRHVAQCWDESHNPMPVKSVSVRVNLVDGSSTILELNSHGNMPWFLPLDDSVDLAVLPLGFDQKRVQYVVVPLASFANDDLLQSKGISEGERIVFSGFFYQFQGIHKMQPIVREGIIAMMPDEELTNTTGKPGKVYLGDVHIFGGNSGSPVFINLGGMHGNMMALGEDYRLLGVISGYFYEDEEFSLKVATTIKGKAQANSGIAIIVPAGALKTLIEDPRVQAERDATVASVKTQ